MSGPSTATYALSPMFAIVLAAQALREAREMGREYKDVLAQAQSRAAALETARCALREARSRASVSARQQAEREQARSDRLAALRAAAMANTSARQEDLPDDLDVPADATPIEETLHAYMVQRALAAKADPAQAAQLQDMVARLLGRLDLDAGEPVPSDIEALGRDVALAATTQRAEVLGAQLRLRIQRQREDKAAQRQESGQAQELLDALGDEASPEVLSQLEEVASGAQRMTPATHELARQALATVQAARKHAEQTAAAQVLEESLRDLGYEVDGVQDTLFIEGGVAHFQRHGWGEYFVRLRVGVDDKTFNFNVVRARGAQDSLERKRLDYLAEDRWCAEFPKLLETLAARGIELDVKRLLGAGELPVQEVDPASVPAARDEHADTNKTAKPQEMKRR